MNRKNTVYIDRYEYKNVSQLLNEILRRIEIFNNYNGYTADNILMNGKQFLDIVMHNKELITKKDKDSYILCTKVVLV